MPTLAEEIADEAEALARDYPKGVTFADLAGYFGAPLRDVQRAIETLQRQGKSLPFLKRSATTPEPWQPSGQWRANTHQKWQEGVHPNKKPRTAPEQRADEVRYRLSELVPLFPNGVTVQQFQEHFDLPLEHAYSTIRVLEDEGDAIAGQAHERPHHKIIWVRGMRALPPPLTELQERVYNEILRVADGKTKVIVNYLHTAKATNTSPGSSPQVCWALERKGYIRRLTPYGDAGGIREDDGTLNGQRSPEYEILNLRETDPFEKEQKKPTPKGIAPHPEPPPVIRDQTAVKRAVARRAELVREIERIDAFLSTFAELSK